MGLLNDSDLQMASAALGPRCELLAPTAARLYLADPDPRQWTYSNHMGVVGVSKDRNRKSYFIVLVSLATRTAVWEQEIYNEMQYKTPRPFFHTFATDRVMAGLSFADEMEAAAFKEQVMAHIARQSQSTQRPVSTSSGGGRPQSALLQPSPEPSVAVAATSPSTSRGGGWFGGASKTKPAKKGKKKISARDISGPTNFEHRTHIGFDKEKGLSFDVNTIPPEWLELFNKAGVTKEQLQNEDDRKFIFDFMQQQQPSLPRTQQPAAPLQQPPPAPAGPPPASNRGAPPAPPARGPRSQPPPPPPQRNSGPPSAPPSAPPSQAPGQRKPPPGPPPPVGRTGPPPPPSNRDSMPPPPEPEYVPPPPPMSGPPPPPAGGPPPPPPPPPPPGGPKTGGGPPPPPPPPAAGAPKPPGPPPPASGGAPKAAPPGGDRGDLLAAIRATGGAGMLKKREVQDLPPPPPPQDGGDLASALSRALAMRSNAMHADSDEEGEDDDNEWSD